MKINYWTPLIIAFGIVGAIAIICIAIFKIKKLDLYHKETMADKDFAREMYNQSISSPSISIGSWQIWLRKIRETMIEICPGFVIKFLGF